MASREWLMIVHSAPVANFSLIIKCALYKLSLQHKFSSAGGDCAAAAAAAALVCGLGLQEQQQQQQAGAERCSFAFAEC